MNEGIAQCDPLFVLRSVFGPCALYEAHYGSCRFLSHGTHNEEAVP